jgi:hypothetical protein
MVIRSCVFSNALLALDNHLSPREQNKCLLHASICRNILKPSLDEVWGSISVGLAFLIWVHSGGCGAAGPALRSRIAAAGMIRLVGEWLLDGMKRTESENLRCTSQFLHANCYAQLSVKGKGHNLRIEDTVLFRIQRRVGSGSSGQVLFIANLNDQAFRFVASVLQVY